MRANYSYRGNFENNQHTHNVHLLLKIFDMVYDLNVAFWDIPFNIQCKPHRIRNAHTVG